VIEYIESRKLLDRTLLLGEHALRRFKELEEKYEFIGDVRGVGFMIGIEIVKDKKKQRARPL
jgi:4-aminobutyrate aminotransferase-like enzyme